MTSFSKTIVHVNPETGSSKRSQVGCGSGSTSALIQLFDIAMKGCRAVGALAAQPCIYIYIYIYIHLYLFRLLTKDCRADGALEARPPWY